MPDAAGALALKPLAWDRAQASPNAVEIVCDRHARRRGDAIALVHEQDGAQHSYSFARLRDLSQRFASVLLGCGIAAGDRVALLLGQGPEFPIALLACWRIGAVAVPIAPLFSGSGLAHRLSHSDARAVLTDAAGCQSIARVKAEIGEPVIWCTGPAPADARSFWRDVDRAAPHCAPAPVGGSRPAYLMYTSGTTGKAKGVLHSHGGLLATLAGGASIHHDPQPDDIAWSPASWAWIAGFGGLLLYFLSVGRPVVAWDAPGPFDPERTYDFLARNRIRNSLLTPTMLRMLGRARAPQLSLRTLLCTGEAIDAEVAGFCRDELGVVPCEAYGQTECAPISVSNAAIMPERLGSLGRPVRGLTLAILAASGEPAGAGERGEIAIGRRHPSIFREYWRDPVASASRFRGDWLMTGDEGWRDEQGFFWFVGRSDDVIKSSGYRIGPGEIESCLAGHPAVELAAAFGLPDRERGSQIAAAVTLRDGMSATRDLEAELVAFARERLERHECPRRVMFLDRMPLTGTGKVMRKEVRALFCGEAGKARAP